MSTQRSAFLEQEQEQKQGQEQEQEQERKKIKANPVHHTLEGQVDQLKIMALAAIYFSPGLLLHHCAIDSLVPGARR